MLRRSYAELPAEVVEEGCFMAVCPAFLPGFNDVQRTIEMPSGLRRCCAALNLCKLLHFAASVPRDVAGLRHNRCKALWMQVVRMVGHARLFCDAAVSKSLGTYASPSLRKVGSVVKGTWTGVGTRSISHAPMCNLGLTATSSVHLNA